MKDDFGLIETLRLDAGGGYFLLARHLGRLAASAQALGFALDEAAVRAALENAAATCRREGGGTWRVRLVLARGGGLELTRVKIKAPDPARDITFALAGRRVDSADPLLRHKTTRRDLFEGEWRRAHQMVGADEVLFMNERGELTEGARSNLFIEQENGRLATPPLSCGLLPGTLRAELLASGRAAEQVLFRDDLNKGRVFFGNSVRGLQPARQIADLSRSAPDQGDQPA